MVGRPGLWKAVKALLPGSRRTGRASFLARRNSAAWRRCSSRPGVCSSVSTAKILTGSPELWAQAASSAECSRAVQQGTHQVAQKVQDDDRAWQIEGLLRAT